jgi:hypothetical protein
MSTIFAPTPESNSISKEQFMHLLKEEGIEFDLNEKHASEDYFPVNLNGWVWVSFDDDRFSCLTLYAGNSSEGAVEFFADQGVRLLSEHDVNDPDYVDTFGVSDFEDEEFE